MFGMLNVVFRPAGGLVSDYIYQHTHSVWAKKLWLLFLGVVTGVFELAIGLSNPRTESVMFGLMAGLAFFMEAANGANFSVVPHVHPFANGKSYCFVICSHCCHFGSIASTLLMLLETGIVSGLVGASGNFGGIIFAIVFRYNGTAYAKSFWIVGAVTVGANLLVGWIRPIPKGQMGGR